jgi:hypothetical protein
LARHLRFAKVLSTAQTPPVFSRIDYRHEMRLPSLPPPITDRLQSLLARRQVIRDKRQAGGGREAAEVISDRG